MVKHLWYSPTKVWGPTWNEQVGITIILSWGQLRFTRWRKVFLGLPLPDFWAMRLSEVPSGGSFIERPLTPVQTNIANYMANCNWHPTFILLRCFSIIHSELSVMYSKGSHLYSLFFPLDVPHPFVVLSPTTSLIYTYNMCIKTSSC